MRIDPKGSIVGRPALEIRRLLRYMGDSLCPCELVSHRLNIFMPEAQQVIEALVEAGYLEPAEGRFEQPHWQTTRKGTSLALASAARPVRRAVAERKVQEFLERVRYVNAHNRFLYRIAKVVVFGSYLGDSPTVNDVDLGVEFQLRYKDESMDEQQKRRQRCVREARRKGRRIESSFDEIVWPEQEVWLFLKSGSRTLSLHGMDDPVDMQVECRTLFEEEVVLQ